MMNKLIAGKQRSSKNSKALTITTVRAARHDTPPVPQLVNKPTRMTANKRAALQCLADLGSNFLDWGTPPYAISLLAEQMGADLSNLTKTMRALERAGLVVREMAETTCWNAIAQAHMPRRCVCYWLAETMEQDKVRAEVWRADAADRSEAAFTKMFASRLEPAIDVSARILPSAQT